ncbi:hypothetical protein BSK63_23590 [Paenibacillus odorifer]|uniref:hypothetical protein n=1 Tax=Paenibacillus odorifer TaxID=189426 RepID=UPI00096CE186|nr:hypothetical protein [Paenibacillus odorifer]OME28897.1 hypothetical protein BSK63_23590 [Paenibacillus odorifer]
MKIKPYFTREELIAVIRNGDDSINNSLIVETDGSVKLVPFDRNRTDCAVRLEASVAGNDYVGAKSDLSDVTSSHQLLLEGWVDFLKYGKYTFKDYCEYKKTIDELQTEAEVLVEKMFG